MNLLWVIFAHVVGDWGLQNPWVAENKGKYWMVMIAHCMVWTGCVGLALVALRINTSWNFSAYWKGAFLFFGHMLMDKIKCEVVHVFSDRRQRGLLYIDQAFHILQCYVVFNF